jgi:uncharacterized protein (DUF58 family)
MGAALELLVIPVLVLVAIIIAAVWTNLSAGAIVLGALLLVLLLGAIITLLRLEWRVEEEEGVHEETGHTADVRKRHDAKRAKSALQQDSTREADIVEECGEESFPASDPPAWTLGRTRGPTSSHRKVKR